MKLFFKLMLIELTLTFAIYFLAGFLAETMNILNDPIDYSQDILTSIIAPFGYGLMVVVMVFVYMFIPSLLFLIMTIMFYCKRVNTYLKCLIGVEAIILALLPFIIRLLFDNSKGSINIDITLISTWFLIPLGQYYKYIFIKRILIKANHYGAVLPSKMTKTPSFKKVIDDTLKNS